MDHTEIQKRVNEISAAMLGKGLARPSASIRFECNTEPQVYLRWKDVTEVRGNEYQNSFQFFSGANPDDALSKADAFVAALPSADEAKLKQFMGALANVIDLGKEHGIDVEFMNPLQATMKQLSKNILTDQRAA